MSGHNCGTTVQLPAALRSWDSTTRRQSSATMANPSIVAIICWAMVSVLVLASSALAETTLHVAMNGNDDNPGTAAQPLASMEGARLRVRQINRQINTRKEAVTVVFAAGTYSFNEPVSFEAADSGTAAAAIVYRAAAGAQVRFSGGHTVSDWREVSDASVLERLPEESLGHVRVTDLRSQGIVDYGELAVRGFSRSSPVAEAELFWNDQPMTLARWPNEGFRGASRLDGVERVTVDTDRIGRWVDESDPWIFAYWFYDWAELYEPIVGLDPDSQVIVRSAQIEPTYGIAPERTRWYAYNLLSELDQPGEYYLDRDNGLLYFWPPEPVGAAILSAATGFIRGEGLSHVIFKGLTFEACRSTAVTISNGSHVRVEGCTIRNTGQSGISISGSDCEVFGCDIYGVGAGGLSMSGGDRPTLTPSGHNAENNHVHDYSRRVRTYQSAISVSGVGGRIAHNLIHDGPHMALSAGGNDHVIEYNEVHNVVHESGDAGAYYVGRDWTQRGNVLRYNYWHQIVGIGSHGGMTIYLDDQHSGHTIHGNLFEKTSRSVFIGGGDDNTVTNNAFIDCWRGAHVDNRGMGWQKPMSDEPDGTLRSRLREMPYQSPLWRQRYPNLVGILDDDPGVPKRNVFRRNISAGRRWEDIHYGTRLLQTIEDNLVFDDDPEWIKLIKDDRGRPLRLEFKDPDAVASISFEQLPLEKMGLYEDERRASWPVHHLVRAITLPEVKPQANLQPEPVHEIPRSSIAVAIDGVLDPQEWRGLKDDSMVLAVEYEGGIVEPPARAWLSHDGEKLHVAITSALGSEPQLCATWGSCEAVELAFQSEAKNAETLVLRGFATGDWEMTPETGASSSSLDRLVADVHYAATVDEDHWSAEWEVPLANIGLAPGSRARFNLTVRRTAGSLWVMWRPTYNASWTVSNTGTIHFAD